MKNKRFAFAVMTVLASLALEATIASRQRRGGAKPVGTTAATCAGGAGGAGGTTMVTIGKGVCNLGIDKNGRT